MTDVNKVSLIVVDDEVAICELVSHAMSRRGFLVVTASSGEEALAMIDEKGVDVALVDIGLPGVSGIALTRQLVRTTDTIVLLMTGDDVTYSYETAMDAGAMDFIVKPIRLNELPLRIDRARGLRDAARSRERMIAELERMATTDELTQLFNVRQFSSVLEREVDRSRRYGRALSLILFDIDHFKRVNDQHGHPVGDQVLRHVANLIETSCRRADTAFRYGGEEFALILPETNAEKARSVAERVRQVVERQPFAGDVTINVSVSAGVAQLTVDEGVRDLVRRSDEALYSAKRQGRNRVVCARSCM